MRGINNLHIIGMISESLVLRQHMKRPYSKEECMEHGNKSFFQVKYALGFLIFTFTWLNYNDIKQVSTMSKAMILSH